MSWPSGPAGFMRVHCCHMTTLTPLNPDTNVTLATMRCSLAAPSNLHCLWGSVHGTELLEPHLTTRGSVPIYKDNSTCNKFRPLSTKILRPSQKRTHLLDLMSLYWVDKNINFRNSLLPRSWGSITKHSTWAKHCCVPSLG